MKILFGIQGTGNGHITRARALAAAFREKNITVDYMVSGRSPDKLFDMDIFGDFRCFEGLTFATRNGSISQFGTVLKNNLWRFYRDVRSLDLRSYDLVISDFEPVSAWAARLRGVPSLAIGHQSAFKYDIPKEGDDLLSRKIMEWFAPTTIHIGLHWHHFQLPLLPPMIEKNRLPITSEDKKILVYLPFENIHHIIRWLEPYGGYRFHVYHEESTVQTPAHIRLCPLSRVSFPRDLASCEGVISNAGFELASEALTLGKKILVKPLHGQYEQLSNAKALKQLGFGEKMDTLDHDALPPWLAGDGVGRIDYPDVATTLCQWICNGMQLSLTELSRQLWQQTRLPQRLGAAFTR